MRLSDSDRQCLALMVKALQTDADFVAHMAWPEPPARRGPAGWLRARSVLISVMVTLGLAAVALVVLGSVYVWVAALAVGSVLLALDLVWGAVYHSSHAAPCE